MSKELKAYCPYANRDGFYHKSEVDKVLAEKDKEIAELKQKLEDVQASAYSDIDEVDCTAAELKAKLDEKDTEITELKNLVKAAEEERDYYKNIRSDKHEKEIESLKASHYAEMVDAAMRERRLRRALYKACANWAKCEERISNMEAYDASEYLPSAENKFRKKAERWSKMESKCRAKAEEYK